MLHGVFTALVTPFSKNGDLDIGALKAIVQNQLESGIDGLVPIGTTAESPTLDDKEKELIIQTVALLAKGKVPIIAGSGSNCTKSAIEATKKAKDAGADYTLQDRKSTRLNSSH